MILADLAMRATVILAAALAATLVLRRAAAATRHLVWTLAVAGVLALPVLGAALPAWTVLPAVDVPQGIWLDMPEIDVPSLGGGSGRHLRARSGEAEPMRHKADSGRLPFGAVSVALAGKVAVAAWLLVAGVLLARIAAGIAAVRRIGRHARPADARSRAILDEIVARTGVDAPIRLLVSRDISTPMTWGGRHPLLLLPREALTWCDDRIRMVLLHEVAHIRRADWLSHLAGRLALACHWFNPLAWIAVRAMTRERERACDDYVVLQGSPAADYAQHLLDIARSGAGGSGWAIAPAMARRSELEGRLLSILTPHRRESSRATPVGLTIAAVAAAACIAAAAPATVPGGTAAPRPRPATAPQQPSVPAPAPQASTPAPQPSPAAVAAVAAERQDAQQMRNARTAVLGALNDESEDVREKAALALALQSGDDVVEPLLGALKDSSAQVREKAALGLAFRRQPAVVEALLEAVHDPDAQVREKAVFALSFTGDPRAIPALAAAAQDPDPQVREKAVQGLALASSDAGSLVGRNLMRHAVRGVVAGALAAIAR